MELFREGKPDFLTICRLPLFYGISPNGLEKLAQELSFAEEHFLQGDLIFRCGQTVSRLAIVTQGTARADIQAVSFAESNAMGYFAEGAILGLETAYSSRRTSPSDIMAETPVCTVVSFNFAPLLAAPPGSTRLLHNWLSLLSDNYVRMTYWVKVLNQRSLREKILTFVYIMCTRDNSDSFVLRMTQDEFASYLRVARQSLNRELQALKREGFLSIQGRRYTLLKLPHNWRRGGPAYSAELNENIKQSGF